MNKLLSWPKSRLCLDLCCSGGICPYCISLFTSNIYGYYDICSHLIVFEPIICLCRWALTLAVYQRCVLVVLVHLGILPI